MKWLILTDHRGHSDQNSVYALSRALAADKRTEYAVAISRGVAANEAFFGGDLSAPVSGPAVTADFTFKPSGDNFRAAGPPRTLADFDVVWLRLPPPAAGRLLTALAAYADDHDLRIINDPRGIVRTGSKDFLLRFPEWTAPSRRCADGDELRAFAARFPLVLKPLAEYGGRGLLRVTDGRVVGEDRKVTLDEWLIDNDPADYLAMQFLARVTEGDKRILVVNGRILGASLRKPAAGEWLCNVARGGTSVAAEVTERERKMVAAVSPVLLGQGVVICGLDTLTGDDGRRVLSEINANSIGGFPQAAAQSGRPVLEQTIDELYRYLAGDHAGRPAGRPSV